MELDIYLESKIPDEQANACYDQIQLQSLFIRRIFCDLTMGYTHPPHASELDQLSQLTKVSLTSLWDMQYEREKEDSYPHASPHEELEAKEARQNALRASQGNLPRILQLLHNFRQGLQDYLPLAAHLHLLPLDQSDHDAHYYRNFNALPASTDPYPHFGQDLHCLQQQLYLHQSFGADTVWFSYG